MPRPLISRKTLIEFPEYITGWVLREIDDEFSTAGIPLAESTNVEVKSGARRCQIELYYASLDLTTPDDTAKLLGVFENVLATTRHSDAQHSRGLVSWLKKDGYVYEGGRIGRLGPSGMQHMRNKLGAMDNARIHDQIRPNRILDRRRSYVRHWICKRID